MTRVCFAATLAALFFVGEAAPRARPASVSDPAIETALKPTSHPRLASDSSLLWLAPDAAARTASRAPLVVEFAEAVKLEVDNNFARALPMLSRPSGKKGTPGQYAGCYHGVPELRRR